MSSVSWARARVRTAQALAAKEKLAAHSEVESALTRRGLLCEAARQASADWGVDLGEPATVTVGSGSTTSMRRRARALRAANETFEQELEARANVVRARRAGDRLTELRRARVAPAATAAPDVTEEVARLLDDAARDGLDMDALTQVADAAVAANRANAELALRHLTRRIADQRAARRAEEARVHELAAQSVELGRLQGVLVAAGADDTAAVSEELASASRLLAGGTPLAPDDLSRLVAAAEAELRHAEERIDQRELERNLLEVLAELGYRPTTGMSTAVVEDGHLVSRSTWHGDHAVEARLDGVDGFRLEAVRVTGDALPDVDRSRDLAVEEELCADLPEVEKRLRSRGIETYDTRTVPAGAMQLARRGNRSALPAPASRRAARRTDTSEEAS